MNDPCPALRAEILERIRLWSPRLHQNQRYREFLERLSERDLTGIMIATLGSLPPRTHPVLDVLRPKKTSRDPCPNGHVGMFRWYGNSRHCLMCCSIRDRAWRQRKRLHDDAQKCTQLHPEKTKPKISA